MLNKIKGIKNFKEIILKKKLGFNYKITTNNIYISKLKQLYLNNKFKSKTHGKKLFDFNKDNIEYLKNNRSYRGMRHKRCLPVRGQRTKTNAKTSKKYKKNIRQYTERKLKKNI
jgi:small subunit ribosomal protein S13